MKTSSAKAKGRRCSQAVKALLLANAPSLEDGDIIVTPSGVTGEDLMLSPKARAKYPWAIECKNVEKLNIWQAIAQTEEHSQKYLPLLFFTRNRSEMYVCMKAEEFVKLYTELLNEQEKGDRS